MKKDMKKRSAITSLALSIIFIAASVSLFGCFNEEKYSLSVTGSELLYEDLNDSYKEGEQVRVKVKITPHQTTVAYLGIIPLTRTKNSGDDFFTFTFLMPNHSAVLSIENIEGFEEDLLVGFHLTFYDQDNAPIENLNKDFDSPEAVAWYCYSYFDEKSGSEVFTSNDGTDVFGNGKLAKIVDTAWGLKELRLESTLYFTYEMLETVACVDWVYFDPQSGEFTLSDGAGFKLNGIGIGSTHNTQNLSETRYIITGEEYEATFDSNVTINFEYIDYLTGVKVLEYDKNNQLIKTNDFTGNSRSETFTVGESCEYAVIEEEYTVMSGENKGEKHYERTLIDKTAVATGKTLKYPRGDGLISPVYLSIIWPV